MSEGDQFSTGKVQLQAAHAQANQTLQVSIKDLLAMFGEKRRGIQVVERIETALRDLDLEADPPLVAGQIDDVIVITSRRARPLDGPADRSTLELPGEAEVPAEPPGVTQPEPPIAISEPVIDAVEPVARPALAVSNVSTSHQTRFFVKPGDPIAAAMSKMTIHQLDFIVMRSSERRVHGAITWESLAYALQRGGTLVDDASVGVEWVGASDDLLPTVGRVIDRGFVLVRDGAEGRLVGSLATRDLSEQFRQLAHPFLLVGEVERLVRSIIDRTFEQSDLQRFLPKYVEAADADGMTFGSYVKLFGDATCWAKLSWWIEQEEFVRELDRVREIRNEIMHFSPDPLDPEDESRLQRFIATLRKVSLVR